MSAYNNLVKKYMRLKIKVPSLSQYNKNTYYYNNKEKIKQNKIKKKLLNKYGYICYASNIGFFVYDTNNNIIYS